MDDHPVHTIPNHRTTNRDVLNQKLLFKSSLLLNGYSSAAFKYVPKTTATIAFSSVFILFLCPPFSPSTVGIRSSVFQANQSFCEQKSNSLVKKIESLLSLFCHERHEQMAHSCSLKGQRERFTHGRSFVRANCYRHSIKKSD